MRKIVFGALLALLVGTALAAGGGPGHPSGRHIWSARGTGYYPSNDPIEGGFFAAYRNYYLPSHTLQAYLRHPERAKFVAVAMDPSIPFGTKLRIPELERRYNKVIIFEVVDRGGAFQGTGTRRIDVCVANRQDAFDATINGPLHLYVQ